MAQWTLEVTSTQGGDLSIASGDGAQLALNKIINHLSGGLNGAQGLSAFTFRDTAVSSSATITLASFAAGTVLLINGVPFTAVGAAATSGNNEFDVSGNDTADAAALAAAINASTTAGITGVLTATSLNAVVTVTSSLPGLAGNAVTIENLGVVATGTITCAGVDEDDTVTINGVTLTGKTAVADATTQWAVGASNAACATNLAALINSTATSALITRHVRALARSAVVHLFARYGGTLGNSITLASSDGTDLAVSAARLAGGTVSQFEGAQASGTIICASAAAADTVTVNGVTFTADATTEGANQWEVSGNDAADAASLAKAINNSATAAAKEVVATVDTATVTVTCRRGGHQGNSITLASSDGTRLAVSGARLTGGADPTVAVIAGGARTVFGGGARLTGGSQDTALDFML